MRNRVIKFIEMWQNSLTKIINEGINKGELKPCPELTVFSSLFISLVEGTITLSKTMKGTDHSYQWYKTVYNSPGI